jgi:hypothetical protein
MVRKKSKFTLLNIFYVFNKYGIFERIMDESQRNLLLSAVPSTSEIRLAVVQTGFSSPLTHFHLWQLGYVNIF